MMNRATFAIVLFFLLAPALSAQPHIVPRDAGPWELVVNGLPTMSDNGFPYIESMGACDGILYADDVRATDAPIGDARPGIYESFDHGDHWAFSVQLPRAQSGNITRMAALGDTMFVSVAGWFDSVGLSGVYQKTRTSACRLQPGSPENLGLLAVAGTRLYGATSPRLNYYTRIWQYDGRGAWAHNADTLPPNFSVSGITTNGSALVIGDEDTNGVVRSIDAGATWSAANNGLPTPDSTANYHEVTGATQFGSKMFIALGYGYTNAGIYMSVDGGVHWQPASIGLPRTPAFPPGTFTAHPVYALTSLRGMLVAMMSEGVFASKDSARTWIDINANLPVEGQNGNTFFRRPLILTADSSYLYCTYDGIGVWRRPLDRITAGVEAEPQVRAANGLIIHPNPATESIGCAFDLPQREHVTLRLYDAVGHLIISVDKGAMERGHHDIMLASAGLAPGAYMVCVEHGGAVTSGVVIVAH